MIVKVSQRSWKLIIYTCKFIWPWKVEVCLDWELKKSVNQNIQHKNVLAVFSKYLHVACCGKQGKKAHPKSLFISNVLRQGIVIFVSNFLSELSRYVSLSQKSNKMLQCGSCCHHNIQKYQKFLELQGKEKNPVLICLLAKHVDLDILLPQLKLPARAGEEEHDWQLTLLFVKHGKFHHPALCILRFLSRGGIKEAISTTSK